MNDTADLENSGVPLSSMIETLRATGAPINIAALVPRGETPGHN
jgi:hypothetical protein